MVMAAWAAKVFNRWIVSVEIRVWLNLLSAPNSPITTPRSTRGTITKHLERRALTSPGGVALGPSLLGDQGPTLEMLRDRAPRCTGARDRGVRRRQQVQPDANLDGDDPSVENLRRPGRHHHRRCQALRRGHRPCERAGTQE